MYVAKQSFLVIPCHRVIRSDGTFGGFSGLGGIKLKQKLLKLEQKMTKNIIILQHIDIETPGYILDLRIGINLILQL